MMRSGGNMAIVALLGLALAPALDTRVRAAMDLGPYRAIVDRNIFNTQPMPPPPEPPPPPAPPMPNVKLVGLMTITGHPQAIIWYQEPGNPPVPPVTSVMVAGQRDGEIQVLEINVGDKSAKVQIRDNITTLALEAKPVSGAATPAPGSAGIQRPRMPVGAPAAGGPAPSAFAPAPSAFAPAANFRNPAAASAMGGFNGGTPNPVADLSATPAGGIGQTLPTRDVRTTTPQAQQLTPEQQMILIEAQRDAMLRAHDPTAVIMPPTPLGNLLNQQGGGATPNPAAH